MAGIYDKLTTSGDYDLTGPYKKRMAMQKSMGQAPDESMGEGITQNIAQNYQDPGAGSNFADKAAMMGMASGNPYAMAAGLGLSALSGAAKAKQQREQQRRQQVLTALGNIGQGVGSIG